MPGRNNRRTQEPPEDEPLDFADDFEFMQMENERLKKQTENLKLAADEVARDNERLRQQQTGEAESPPIPNTAGVLLLIVAIILAGRMVLYVFLEDYGQKAHAEGLVSNFAFGFATLVMLGAWIFAEWQMVQWLMVPKLVLVLVTLAIAIPAVTGGYSPLFVGMATIGALLIGASPIFIWLLRAVMNFLNDPIGFWRKTWKRASVMQK